jgi:hypothetical protein
MREAAIQVLRQAQDANFWARGWLCDIISYVEHSADSSREFDGMSLGGLSSEITSPAQTHDSFMLQDEVGYRTGPLTF